MLDETDASRRVRKMRRAIREMLCVNSDQRNAGMLVQTFEHAFGIPEVLSQLSDPGFNETRLNLTRFRIKHAGVDTQLSWSSDKEAPTIGEKMEMFLGTLSKLTEQAQMRDTDMHGTAKLATRA